MIRVLILRDYFGITAPTQLNPLHWEDPNSSNKRDSTSSYPTKKNKCPGVRKIFNKVENNQHEGSEMKGEFHNGQTMKGFVMSVHLLIKTVLKIRSDCISISITYIYLKKKLISYISSDPESIFSNTRFFFLVSIGRPAAYLKTLTVVICKKTLQTHLKLFFSEQFGK